MLHIDGICVIQSAFGDKAYAGEYPASQNNEEFTACWLSAGRGIMGLYSGKASAL